MDLNIKWKFNLQRAERALKYYKGYKRSCKEEDVAFYKEFESLKSVSTAQNENKKFRIEDFSELNT